MLADRGVSMHLLKSTHSFGVRAIDTLSFWIQACMLELRQLYYRTKKSCMFAALELSNVPSRPHQRRLQCEESRTGLSESQSRVSAWDKWTVTLDHQHKAPRYKQQHYLSKL